MKLLHLTRSLNTSTIQRQTRPLDEIIWIRVLCTHQEGTISLFCQDTDYSRTNEEKVSEVVPSRTSSCREEGSSFDGRTEGKTGEFS